MPDAAYNREPPRVVADATTPANLHSGDPELPPPTPEQKIGALALVVLALVAVVILGIPKNNLAQWAHIGDILGGFAIPAFGALAAGWWFLRRDPLRPRLNISHDVQLIREFDQGLLLAVFGDFTNIGETMIEIGQWSLGVSTLVPCPDYLMDELMVHRVCADSHVNWEATVRKDLAESELGKPRIRPGESQRLVAFALVPSGAEVLRLYSAVPHPKLRMSSSENRAWEGKSIVVLQKANDKTNGNAPPTPEPVAATGSKVPSADTRLISTRRSTEDKGA